jgi:hypothetical protein
MLIQKSKYSKDDIITFKLVNGDELVAKLVEETEISFIIAKPTSVVPQGQGIGLIQALFTTELARSIELDKAHVMMHAHTSSDVAGYYTQLTTGIAPAPKQKLIV